MLRNLLRDEKGAALLEYSLLAAGVALISAAGVAIFGHKTNDMISSVAAIMPGVHADDNGPIVSGKIIETTSSLEGDGTIQVDVATIVTNAGTTRFATNLGVDGTETGLGGLVLEVGEE
jgi:Flp pilus assembly pilin Flp